MREVIEKIGIVKTELNRRWLGLGIPQPFLETTAAHTIEAALLAVSLAEIVDECDACKVALIALAHELEGSECMSIAEALKEYRVSKSIEAKIVRLAHELSTLLQAGRYHRQGFRVESVMKESLSKALDLTAEIGHAELAQAVHEILTMLGSL